MTVRVTAVEPIGAYKALCHIHYADRPHAFEERVMPLYPKAAIERGNQLRERRVDAGLTIGELARELGIRPADVSNVEHGRAYIEEGQDAWDDALAAFRGSK